jgi:hypothetical protein
MADGQITDMRSLVRFFDTRDYPDLAWMHHLACRRYGDAGSDLLVVDQSTESLAQKHVSPYRVWLPRC